MDVLSMLLVFSLLQNCQGLFVTKFRKEQICNVTERMTQGCATEAGVARSLMTCLTECSRAEKCVGVTLATSGRCVQHQLCHSKIPCQSGSQLNSFWAKFCVTGTWNVTTRSCQCVKGATGERCNNYPKDCGDLLSAGYTQGDYRVFLDPDQDGEALLDVLCTVQPPVFHSVRIMVNVGGMDFNRSMEEYEDGFYDQQGNLWGGLRAWSVLSNAGYDTAVFELGFYDAGMESSVVREYRDFILSPQNDGYKFTFSASSVDFVGPTPGGAQFGDCMDPLKNLEFSTRDFDKDSDGAENCASLAGSGWWYTSCSAPCILLGWTDNWPGTPAGQRLTVTGVDMATLHPKVTYVRTYLHSLN